MQAVELEMCSSIIFHSLYKLVVCLLNISVVVFCFRFKIQLIFRNNSKFIISWHSIVILRSIKWVGSCYPNIALGSRPI